MALIVAAGLAAASLVRSALDVVLLACLAAACVAFARTHGRRPERGGALSGARGGLVDALLDSEEQQRRRIADMLHDGPVQQMMLARASLAKARPGAPSRAEVAAAEQAIDEALGQLRGSMQDLHSHVLDFAGLEAALVSEVERALPDGMRCEIAVDPDAVGFSDRLLFEVARELLLNACRHGRGTRVSVAVARRGDMITLVVGDDGTGFAPDRRMAALRAGHVGLASCAQRVEAVGGRFEVHSASGTGTQIVVTLPIRGDRGGRGDRARGGVALPAPAGGRPHRL
ncbi:MAG TPA: ATP-binding protein [Solirubrobacteraceae bacterium]|nr:ATP-binding protein [Solirubrobacteraceae bacterium]